MGQPALPLKGARGGCPTSPTPDWYVGGGRASRGRAGWERVCRPKGWWGPMEGSAGQGEVLAGGWPARSAPN